MEVIGKMQPELFACAAEKVNKQNDNLQYAGGQRADRRTADAQLRESEMTENQKIVNRTSSAIQESRNAMPTISTLRRVASRICVIAKNR